MTQHQRLSRQPEAVRRLRRLVRPALLLSAAGVVAVAVPGSAADVAPGPAVVAPAYAQVAGYATPTVVMKAGMTLSFLNTDVLSVHNVTSKQVLKIKHCRTVRHRTRCTYTYKPLFASPLVAPGNDAPISATAHLKPGSYAFYCTLHGGMKGTLIVE